MQRSEFTMVRTILISLFILYFVLSKGLFAAIGIVDKGEQKEAKVVVAGVQSTGMEITKKEVKRAALPDVPSTGTATAISDERMGVINNCADLYLIEANKILPEKMLKRSASGPDGVLDHALTSLKKIVDAKKSDAWKSVSTATAIGSITDEAIIDSLVDAQIETFRKTIGVQNLQQYYDAEYNNKGSVRSDAKAAIEKAVNDLFPDKTLLEKTKIFTLNKDGSKQEFEGKQAFFKGIAMNKPEVVKNCLEETFALNIANLDKAIRGVCENAQISSLNLKEIVFAKLTEAYTDTRITDKEKESASTDSRFRNPPPKEVIII